MGKWKLNYVRKILRCYFCKQHDGYLCKRTGIQRPRGSVACDDIELIKKNLPNYLIVPGRKKKS